MHKIVFSREAAKEYDKLEIRIQDKIDEKLSLLSQGDFSLLNIDKMEGRDDTFRMRIGDYRLIYEKDGPAYIITIIKIKHRKDVYRGY